MRRFAFVLALLLAFAAPAAAKNRNQEVMAITEVATGTPVPITIDNPNNTTGYLFIKTENETATASLQVLVYNWSALGNALVCTLTPITTNTTTVALLGSTLTAADGITDVCDWPMSRRIVLLFTTSGAGADFDVTAEMEWIEQ